MDVLQSLLMSLNELLGPDYIIQIMVAYIVGYILPAAIATFNRHPKATAVTLVSLLINWTIIGWFVCFFWAVKGGQPAAQSKRKAVSKKAAVTTQTQRA